MALHRKQVTYSSRPNRAARIAHARGDREFRTYDTSYIQPKRSKVPVIAALVLALVVIAIAVVLVFRGCAGSSVELLPEGEQAVVTIDQGESAQQIGEALVEARLVGSADEFVSAVKQRDVAAALIPGTYSFQGGATLDSILQALTTGPSATGATLTVPEGYKRADIATAVEEATGGRITAQDFLDASSDASVYAADYDFLADAGTNALEGFLFPKTYTITAADDAQAVVRMMLDQFRTETASLDWSYPESHNLSIYDAVNLASIVEKEAAVDQNTGEDNRATVASVFYNRLASDRPYLESDATTAYEVGHEPTAEEVHADTPYSTYTHEGLPPTPICSPSLACLQAVCSPEETNYLFFYFEPDENGNLVYHFSETYEEHQAAIG